MKLSDATEDNRLFLSHFFSFLKTSLLWFTVSALSALFFKEKNLEKSVISQQMKSVRDELLNIVEHLAAKEQRFPSGREQTQRDKTVNAGVNLHVALFGHKFNLKVRISGGAKN